MKWENISVYGVLIRLTEIWQLYERRRVLAAEQGVLGPTVIAGPFKGLRFSPGVDLSAQLPKILGSYESELNADIEKIISHGFGTVVNIGAAEGYYAIGIAMLLPQCKVFAFEMDDAARQHCEEAVLLNQVDSRVTVLGKCDWRSLVALPMEGTLLIVDCEGAELDILREDMAPQLAKTWLVVELHDALRPGCSRILWERFRKTHDMKFITAEPRDPERFPVLNRLRPRQQKVALDEIRLGIQEWVVMTPKAAANPGIVHISKG